VAARLQARSTRFDIQLHPLGLGQVNVSVEIGSEGRLSARLLFERPEAAAELRARSGELQSALAAAGFDVSAGLTFATAEPARTATAQNEARQDGAAAWQQAGQGLGQGGGDQPRQDGSAGPATRPTTLFTAAADRAEAHNQALVAGARSRRGVDVRI
jgi:hypothetical protein